MNDRERGGGLLETSDATSNLLALECADGKGGHEGSWELIPNLNEG